MNARAHNDRTGRNAKRRTVPKDPRAAFDASQSDFVTGWYGVRSGQHCSTQRHLLTLRYVAQRNRSVVSGMNLDCTIRLGSIHWVPSVKALRLAIVISIFATGITTTRFAVNTH